MIRVRIAPSPTGYPHIGTIYQALLNFAYAKKHGGTFIVRIEDTDRERFVADAEEKLFKALDWFGLTEGESPRKGGPFSPYRQSERLELYRKYAKQLVDQKDAYYCFCTKQRLDDVRSRQQKEKKPIMYDKHCRNLSHEDTEKNLKINMQYVIRMKIPETEKIVVRDEIRGEILFDSNTIDDQVILKSDGFPTYHLAFLVDDHEMEISHVVRAEEWLPSTPKHVLLYRYLGWRMPPFYHTPALRNPDHSKLSKRQGHTNVSFYQEEGFLPEAILNYLALMAWSHPEEKEIFSLEEFIKYFDLKDIKPTAPIFDIKKLEWMNGEYIRKTENSKLKSQIWEYLGKKYSEDIIEKTVPLIKDRIKKLSDYLSLCEFFFKDVEEYEIDLSGKKEMFDTIKDSLFNLKEWGATEIGEILQKTAKDMGIKNSEFFMLLRVAITGKKISPPLNESMGILGKERVLARLKRIQGL